MEGQLYKRQVALLLNVLPEIAKETCFALHGGTAINLFVRDMPRLSVDIDLTYIPIESRDDTLLNITQALKRIKSSIERILPDVKVLHKQENLKLQVSSTIAQIKVEVNQAMRGIINESKKMSLCKVAQDEFDVFCAIQIVPFEQLYGGKICAALDRQHPRDLFDVKYLLNNEGFTAAIKKGFLLGLLSSNRPLNEMLYPNFLDQQLAMTNQFEGMSNKPFNYQEFEETREALVDIIHKNLTDRDKEFLLSFKNLTPNWSIYDFEKFPAVQWKLQNLQKLKDSNPIKYIALFKSLKEKLNK
ncbi:MAG: nucleotidyl transferase AbiEii/AbiGii toxin family protein [Flavobacteriaceae bacterium]|nr:nucleotidyl transferase AbiEii/AbiGii toxin family protein [Flavobacteriaceae bacterium]